MDTSDDSDITGKKYIIVRSSSTVLASASNKLSTWVSMKMEEGWTPNGPPQIIFVMEKYNMIQSMIKN